jgi:hypothetical protein
MSAFLAALVSAFKAITALRDIGDMFTQAWLLYQENQDDQIIDKAREVRAGLLAALKQPGLTNENRRAIRQHLFDLYYSGKLPKSPAKT